MFNSIKNLLGFGPKTDFKSLYENGAIVLDVRTIPEFINGNIPGSINIPLNDLPVKMRILKDKQQNIICCCASGMRSGVAKKILQANGYTNVVNGGGYLKLLQKIS